MVYAVRLLNDSTGSSAWIISGSEDKLNNEDYLVDGAIEDFLSSNKDSEINLADALDNFESFCSRHSYVLDWDENKNSAIEYDDINDVYFYEGEPITILKTKTVRF